MKEYKSDVCDHCGQSTTYLLGLDKGSVDIVLEILKAVTARGVNEVHPGREMGLDGDKKWYLTNLSRPRFHGLIAYVKDKKGYYCLTRKAGQFLRGHSIPRYAIISKSEHHQIGYWEPDKHRITLQEAIKSDEMPYWEGDVSRMIDKLDPVHAGQGILI